MNTEKMEDECKKLREALKFYRDGFRFVPRRSVAGIDLSAWEPTEALLEDCGNVACAALSEGGAA